jgi:hypothetical protein
MPEIEGCISLRLVIKLDRFTPTLVRRKKGRARMGGNHQTLRDLYAQYFFSVFDASLHQDEAGRRLAQQCLEDSLTDSALVVPPGPEPSPGYAW